MFEIRGNNSRVRSQIQEVNLNQDIGPVNFFAGPIHFIEAKLNVYYSMQSYFK